MAAIELSPYLNFEGNCREAMEFYKTVFGGKLEISTFAEFGGAPEGYADKVMHATLTGDDVSFMASDGMPGRPVVFGDSVNISLAGKDAAKLTKFFEALSAGGMVTVPLAKQVWGDVFGMCTDQFGIHWLVNIGMDSSKA